MREPVRELGLFWLAQEGAGGIRTNLSLSPSPSLTLSLLECLDDAMFIFIQGACALYEYHSPPNQWDHRMDHRCPRTNQPTTIKYRPVIIPIPYTLLTPNT